MAVRQPLDLRRDTCFFEPNQLPNLPDHRRTCHVMAMAGYEPEYGCQIDLYRSFTAVASSTQQIYHPAANSQSPGCACAKLVARPSPVRRKKGYITDAHINCDISINLDPRHDLIYFLSSG